MGTLIARVWDFALMAMRQAVPWTGVVAHDWHPVTGLAIFWVESMLLVLVAAVLCARLQRRSAAALAAVPAGEGDDRLRELHAERVELEQAKIAPLPVLLFHGGSLVVFGLFSAAVVLIATQKGYFARPFDPDQFMDGFGVMAAIVATGLVVDLWHFERMPVAAVAARVHACLGRWALFWLLGFAGTILMVATGSPGAFFGFFAGLKLTWEVWGSLSPRLGWRPVGGPAAQAP